MIDARWRAVYPNGPRIRTIWSETPERRGEGNIVFQEDNNSVVVLMDKGYFSWLMKWEWVYT